MLVFRHGGIEVEAESKDGAAPQPIRLQQLIEQLEVNTEEVRAGAACLKQEAVGVEGGGQSITAVVGTAKAATRRSQEPSSVASSKH